MKYKKYIFLFIFIGLFAATFIFNTYIKNSTSIVPIEVQVGEAVPEELLEKIFSKDPAITFKYSKIIVLNFWASWCSPCVEELPSLIKLSHLLNKKINIIAISQDSDVSELNSFLKLYDIKALDNFRVIVDSEHDFSSQLAIDRLPETWILDSNHVLIKKVVGSIDWSSDDVVSYFQSIK